MALDCDAPTRSHGAKPQEAVPSLRCLASGGGRGEVWRFPARKDTLGTAGCIHEGLFIEVSEGFLNEDSLQRLVEAEGPGDMALLTTAALTMVSVTMAPGRGRRLLR